MTSQNKCQQLAASSWQPAAGNRQQSACIRQKLSVSEVCIPARSVVLPLDPIHLLLLDVSKVPQVHLAFDHRHKRRGHCPVHVAFPIKLLEPRMSLQTRDSAMPHWKSITRLLTQDIPDKIPSQAFGAWWKLHTVDASEDLGKHHHVRVSAEWRRAGHQLIHEHAHCPPIHRAGLSERPDDLRCHVVWRPARCVGLAKNALRKPHTRKLEVPIAIKEKILRFHVSVQYVTFM